MRSKIRKVSRGSAFRMQRSAGFLAGVKVYFLTNTITNASSRMRIWERKITSAGASVSKKADDPGVTHVIVGDKPEGLQGLKPPKRAKVVQSTWLEECLSQQKRVPEGSHLINVAAAIAQHIADEDAERNQARGAMRKYQKWLGHWRPEYDSIKSENELVLMVAYDEKDDERVGNGAIVKALVEMEKYWDALQGDFVRDVAEADADEPPGKVQHSVNHNSLSFARVASVVRACAFKIEPGTRPEDLRFPFVGPARAAQICDIATTGTTLELEQHRAGVQVYSSPDADGQRRKYAGAVGSVVRRQFKKLPGVGSSTAKRWYDLGLRTLDDVADAAKPGGPLATGGEAPLTVAQAFSVAHREDLLDTCSEADVAEMRRVVLDALTTVAGNGWTLEIVGGAKRGLASHDADFVVSNKTTPTEGIGNLLYDELCARGCLFPKSEAMCLTQSSRMPSHLQSMREEVLRKQTASFFSLHNLSADRHDHIFGNFLTEAGKVRRVDVIIAPPQERAACILGWTGSRQYLRFLRQYAADRGMHLNSHRIMRKDGNSAIVVPDEGPPLDRDGTPRWPPGWGPGRTVETEQDIFELLGVPYRPPHERNAP